MITTLFRHFRKRSGFHKHFSAPEIESLEDRLLLSMSLGPDNRVVRFNDASGDRVVMKLLGPGSARVTLAGDARSHADLNSLVLTGTRETSKLLIKVDADGGDSSLVGIIVV